MSAKQTTDFVAPEREDVKKSPDFWTEGSEMSGQNINLCRIYISIGLPSFIFYSLFCKGFSYCFSPYYVSLCGAQSLALLSVYGSRLSLD